MSVQALSWVFDHSPTQGADRLVLLSLANHAGSNEVDGAWECWPGVALITKEAGLRRERTTQDVLARLEAAGAIERKINGAPDSRMRPDRRPNLYRVLKVCGVTSHDTPQEANGVTPHAERGDASRQNGVTRGVTQTVSEPSAEPTTCSAPSNEAAQLTPTGQQVAAPEGARTQKPTGRPTRAVSPSPRPSRRPRASDTRTASALTPGLKDVPPGSTSSDTRAPEDELARRLFAEVRPALAENVKLLRPVLRQLLDNGFTVQQLDAAARHPDCWAWSYKGLATMVKKIAQQPAGGAPRRPVHSQEEHEWHMNQPAISPEEELAMLPKPPEPTPEELAAVEEQVAWSKAFWAQARAERKAAAKARQEVGP